MNSVLSRVGLAAALLTLASPALAVPASIGELQQAIDTRYGGNATLYARGEERDFRKMGCNGRADLVGHLLEQGLDLDALPQDVWIEAAFCALKESESETFRLLMTPDQMSQWDDRVAGRNRGYSLLRHAIEWDDYGCVLTILQNGFAFYNSSTKYLPLSREEHILLAAETALDDNRDEALRALNDAGFGHIVDAARDRDNLSYVEQRIAGSSGGGSGGGGGFLGGLAQMAAGKLIGGAAGAGMMVAGGANALGGGDEDAAEDRPLPPLALASNRAYLGFEFEPIDGHERGVSVVRLVEFGQSAALGLQPGDEVVRIAGLPVATRGSIFVATEQAARMDAFEVEYLRDGSVRTALFETEDLAAAAQRAKRAASAAGETKPDLAGPPAESMPASGAVLENLERLADLRDRGVLSEEEFAEMKARLLAGE